MVMPAGRYMVRAAGIVLVMNLLSRVLGFVRDAVIANEFGATGVTDAFMVAYTIPYFLQAILGMAIVMIIVPLLAEYSVQGRQDEVWKASSAVFNWTLLFLAAVSVVGILASGPLVRLMAPGFSSEMAALARELTQIMFPSIVFMALGMLVTGILNAHHIFGIPAFSPAGNNIVVIIAVLLFGSRFGIHGLAAGTLVGFIVFLLMQLPALRNLDVRYVPTLDYRHPAVRKTAAGVGPIVFGVGVNQIYLAFNRVFASMVVVGSIAAIDFAYRLVSLPLGIFAAAVSTAVFPSMSEQAAAGDRDGLRHTLVRGLNIVTFITIPSAVGLMLLNIPLVELLFERGAFDTRATAMTGAALFYFSIGMLGWGADMVLTRAYYAVNDIRTPVMTGVISVAVNILFSFLLLPTMGHAGLALANSLAVTSNFILLFLLLPRHLPGLSVRDVGGPLLRTFAASAFMGVLVFWLNTAVSLPLLLQVAACISLGVLAYGAAAIILKVEEARWAVELVAQRFS